MFNNSTAFSIGSSTMFMITAMNLVINKRYWVLELFLIMLLFSLINIAVLFTGYTNIYITVFCQLLNLLGLSFLLFISIKHIIALTGNEKYKWLNFLNKKISITDIFLILMTILLSKIASALMMKIKIVNFFNISLFKGLFLDHLSLSEKKLFIVIVIISLVVGVFAEEFYFRRYLFEIQSVHFKNYTWIINGFSWSIYHVFSPSNFLALLPSCLLYAYVYQKRKNIWITIIAHLISNIMALYPALKANL